MVLQYSTSKWRLWEKMFRRILKGFCINVHGWFRRMSSLVVTGTHEHHMIIIIIMYWSHSKKCAVFLGIFQKESESEKLRLGSSLWEPCFEATAHPVSRHATSNDCPCDIKFSKVFPSSLPFQHQCRCIHRCVHLLQLCRWTSHIPFCWCHGQKPVLCSQPLSSTPPLLPALWELTWYLAYQVVRDFVHWQYY